MPPAVIAGGIGAAASIGGAILGGNSTKKAAQQASDTSMRTASMNNALAREFYGRNQEQMQPFINRGNAAGSQINSMLGLGGNALAGPAPQAPAAQSWYDTSPVARGGYNREFMGGDTFLRDGGMNPAPMISSAMTQPYGEPVPAQAMPQMQQAAASQGNPADPFRQYIANSDYGFQFGQGSNALNHGYAANGSLQSGAAMKAMEKYRQNLQTGYRGEYMNLLGQQQGVGLSGASALAGVGQGYAGMMTQNNSQAGSDAANAALMRGAANSQMYNGIAGGIGNALGSSYLWWGKGK